LFLLLIVARGFWLSLNVGSANDQDLPATNSGFC
jgi:hypothetical protein